MPNLSDSMFAGPEARRDDDEPLFEILLLLNGLNKDREVIRPLI